MTAIKAVIFDFYGVLGLNGWQAFKAQHFSDQSASWEPLRRLGQQVDAGTANEEEFVTALARATGEAPETIRYQFEHTQLNEPLLDFISRELHGKYKVALLSNASHDVFRTLLSPEQRDLFDVMLSSFDIGLTKPNPQMFLQACERLGVSPEECLMVDDKTQHLDAAARLGMQTVHYESVEQAIEAIGKGLA